MSEGSPLALAARPVELHFTGMKIAGFKSFADPVEIEIRSGTSGIAGPNGCGKSNLVDALRWVMGEASFKNMRGGEMEDVIFSGTAVRPARDMAEVVLMIDNRARTAPAPWNDSDEIEISRRIEREAGSSYRINGREVRAEDVRLLFADIVGGAHASALVSQGRIGEIVSAPPQQRRKILEEAAGITGMQARRHKAELRLSAAEENLARFGENMAAQRGRLRQIKRQARQANRYRALTGEILRLEAVGLFIRYEEARKEHEDATKTLAQIQGQMEEAAALLKTRQAKEQELAAQLPELQNKEREAAAAAERIGREAALWEKEAENHQRHWRELGESLARTREDKTKLAPLKEDADKRHTALAQEAAQLEAQANNGQAAQALRGAQERAQTAAHHASAAEQAEAERRAQINALSREIEAAKAAQAAAQAEAERQKQIVAASPLATPDAGQSAVAAQAQAQAASVAWREALAARDEADSKTRTLTGGLAGAEQNHREQEQEIMRLRGEIGALEAFAPWGNEGDDAVLMGMLDIQPGYRLALAAVLGDEVLASAKAGGAAWWQTQLDKKTLPPLPHGAEPLSAFIKAPDFLMARLSMTGVMEASAAQQAQSSLHPGQRLVSRAGEIWRWDGWHVGASPAKAAEARIDKWQAMAALKESLKEAEKAQKAASAQVAQCTAELEKARNAQSEMAAGAEKAEQAAEEAQQQAALAVQADAKAAQQQAERAAAEKAIHHATAEAEKWQQACKRAEQEAQTLQTEDSLAQAARTAREAAEQAQAELAQLQAQHQAHQARLEEITRGQSEAKSQSLQLAAQIEALVERARKAETELETLQNPTETKVHEGKQAQFAELAGQAQVQLATARDLLAQGEQQHKQAALKAREQESLLADLRTGEAKSEAEAAAAARRAQEIKEQAEASTGRAIEEIPAWVEFEEDAPLPDLGATHAARERLEQERLRLGEPNLQAGAEAEALAEECERMEKEGEDLAQAVKQLHQGVQALDGEARARLKTAYRETEKNFAHLFRHLFGGGEAKLELIGADDILTAGLEIIARPPGKKAQTISLLSGGEKTLTALALLFGAFISRPLPVCVLDEVDAPLDERNIGRFCDLLEEAAQLLKTRFLVVTHHPISLARMDRLFGITMQEKGVSHITGVELAQAQTMREKAA